jgi:hypothetical protein
MPRKVIKVQSTLFIENEDNGILLAYWLYDLEDRRVPDITRDVID